MMRRATYVCLLATACVTPSGEEVGEPVMECVDATTETRFDERNPTFPAIHRAADLLAGEYVASATWAGDAGATMITTSLAYAGDSYEVSVADLGLYCSVSADIPVALALESSDGLLVVESLSTWVQAPGQSTSEDIGLAAVLSADPHDTSWLTISAFQLWPQIANSDDDAKLWLELESTEDGVHGRLDYEKREVVESTDTVTVFYYRDTLLEWSAARMR